MLFVLNYDYDQIVIGTGFGGAVAALRMTEKGYKTLVIERGKRWKSEDFPKTNFNIKKFLWLPRVGFTGFWQITPTRKIVALRASGYGGGSLLYANTHVLPEKKIYEQTQWRKSHNNWYGVLKPFYGLAMRMMGVSINQYEGLPDKLLKDVAEDMHVGDSYSVTNNATYQKEQEITGKHQDPYFSGNGPARSPCELCGGCMVGCRFNAKNTLDKNYLYFSEKNGAEIKEKTEVIDISIVPGANGELDGHGGYELTLRTSLGLWRKTSKIRTKGVVLSAGVLGTLTLLMNAKYKTGQLKNLSDQLGKQVRCNSETFYSISVDKKQREGNDPLAKGMGVTSLFRPDDETVIEGVRFNEGSDAMFLSVNTVPLTDKKNLPRQFGLLINFLKNPFNFFAQINPFGKTKNSILLMIMQSVDAYVGVKWKRTWTKGFAKGMTFEQPKDAPKLTTYFQIGQDFCRKFAKRSNGKASNVLLDILADVPVSGHLMGGASIGSSRQDGVVNSKGEVFGYKNLRVLDGSIIAGNLAANPSVTILALSEYAMSFVPVGNVERAASITPVMFDEPLLHTAADALQGSGDLLTKAINASRAEELAN